ncbi:MAG: class I SAM-dependent methyltransferase [Candidatus Lokiarchaeota archaeon]|nr:class I SAM-dependent methyltransferase [Candidatus Lokiarchaeota archaeon]
MYDNYAEIYDLIYEFLDYEKTAKKIKKLILKNKRTEVNTLLDIACGTGRHLHYLKKDFKCTGVDISDQMLDVARKNYPDIRFIQADMIELDLKEKFDAIICLFSSIGYVKTYENLEKTIINFANHLKQGGVVIIEPWLTKSNAIAGLASMTTYESDDIKIARQCVTKIAGDITPFEMHYMIAKKNEDVIYFKDHHELGLFDTDKTIQMMEEAGIETKYLDKGLETERGLFIGVKKKNSY